MKITTLNPPFLPRFSRGQRSPAVTKSGTLYYPIWLAYATGALEKEGHTVDLIDAPADGLCREDVLDRIQKSGSDLVIVETSTPSISSDVEFSDLLAIQGKIVLLVGTHPSALPIETLELGTEFQGVVVGEYELTLIDAARRLEEEKSLEGIPGLVLRKDGEFIRGPERELIRNLDSLPFVSTVYEKHLNIREYDNPNALYPQVMIIGGRGCPHRCTFCVFPQTIQGRSFRFRSIQNIVQEMLWIQNNLPDVKSIFFEDDTISIDTGRLRELAESIGESNVTLPWSANMRANVDYETLAACKRAGLRTVCVGFESGNDRLLKTMKKGLDTEAMRRFMRDARKASLLVHGCFLFGIPGETLNTMKETLQFALDLDPDTAQFYPLMVYPGTEAYDLVRSKGLMSSVDWREWLTGEGLHSCVIRTEELDSSDLVNFCDHARRKFYLRPGYIARKFWKGFCDRDERARTFKAFSSFWKFLFVPSLRKGNSR